MERNPIGETPLTKAENQRRYHQKLSAAEKAKITKEDKERKKLKRALIKLAADKYTEYKKMQREEKKRKRDLAKKKADDFSINASMHGAALYSSLKMVKGSLTKKETHKRVIAKALFEDTVKLTPKRKKLLTKWAKLEQQLPTGRKNTMTDDMKVMIDKFQSSNCISYTLPGRNNQLYMGKVDGKSQFSPKRYLLWTFQELDSLIIKDAEMEGIKFHPFIAT